MATVVNVVGAVVLFLIILAVVVITTTGMAGEFIDGYREARLIQELEGVDRMRREQLHKVREIGRRYRRQLDEL